MKHDGKCEKMTMFWNARAIRIAQPCHIVAATERLKGYIQNWTSWVTGQGGAMIRSNLRADLCGHRDRFDGY